MQRNVIWLYTSYMILVYLLYILRRCTGKVEQFVGQNRKDSWPGTCSSYEIV